MRQQIVPEEEKEEEQKWGFEDEGEEAELKSIKLSMNSMGWQGSVLLGWLAKSMVKKLGS